MCLCFQKKSINQSQVQTAPKAGEFPSLGAAPVAKPPGWGPRRGGRRSAGVPANGESGGGGANDEAAIQQKMWKSDGWQQQRSGGRKKKTSAKGQLTKSRARGAVLWFDPGKGYGFIKPVSARHHSPTPLIAQPRLLALAGRAIGGGPTHARHFCSQGRCRSIR